MTMKILAFTDVHNDKKCLMSIFKKSQDCDILVCAGDISIFENGLKESLKLLSKAGKPILIIHGNHENEGDIKKLKSDLIAPLHNNIFKFQDYLFFGWGDGGFSRVDKELENKIKKIKTILSKNLVLVTHAPPYNTKLDFIPGIGHRGCISINRIIKNTKPKLLICGHLHENFGVFDRIDNTFVTNPGPIGKIIDL